MNAGDLTAVFIGFIIHDIAHRHRISRFAVVEANLAFQTALEQRSFFAANEVPASGRFNDKSLHGGEVKENICVILILVHLLISPLRSLEAIQADIAFLCKQKETFFTRLFNSHTARINILRTEEEGAIIAMLRQQEGLFSQLWNENRLLLANTCWTLKVINYRNGASHTVTGEIHAHIHTKGFLHGKGTVWHSFGPNTPDTANELSPMGDLHLYAIRKQVAPGHVPTLLHCYTTENGRIQVQRTEQKGRLLGFENIVDDVSGDPFSGDLVKRRQFIKNRGEMQMLIRQQRFNP